MLGLGRPPWLIVNEYWGIAALLINLAELLFQFDGQRFEALPRQVVCLPGQLPDSQDSHFEFHALLF
ncbi:MAG: hypothetical protein Q8M18_18880 [Bradyrhizobium sp.]|nr:hypothetical protein [Bradyrhizobium sp.]